MIKPYHVLSEYWKWRKNWDDLCAQCGQCCYSRSLSPKGELVIHWASPCEYLDEETHKCLVFENRFRTCAYCGSVNLYRALFSPLLPPDCAYVRTFRG